MVSVLSLYLLIIVICQEASSQKHTTRTHTITAGSDTGSLTDYLHNASQMFSSFTTLLFSPGVHDMCEDSVVVIRDVTNIALIGSETTTTKSVEVGGGEVVDMIEPSTVIDCHGCVTGFAFSNVSQLMLKRIMLTHCGGYFTVHYSSTVSPDSTEQYLSSLTLVAVQNLTLDTMSFKNCRANYSLVAINVLGQSTILKTSLVQSVSLFPAYQQGKLLMLYADSLHPQNSINERSTLYVASVVFLYTPYGTGLTLVDDGWPYFIVEISSCTLDIYIILTEILIHIAIDPVVKNDIDLTETILAINVCVDASKYQIDMQHIRFSNTQQNFSTINAIGVSYSELPVNCPIALLCQPTTGTITMTNLVVSQYNGVDITVAIDDESSLHMIGLYHCNLPHLGVIALIESTSYVVEVSITNTTFEKKHQNIDEENYLVALQTHYATIFIDSCSFLHNWGASALYLVGTVTFKGNCIFYNNTATYGGGIMLRGSESAMHLLPHTTLNFTQNSALVTGGALHIENHDYDSQLCFIQLNWINLSLPDIKSNMKQQDIHLLFNNNSAGVAGTVLWGGSLGSRCHFKFNGHVSNYSVSIAQVFDTVSNNGSTLSAVASPPQYICYCNSTITCTSTVSDFLYGPFFTLYPGQSLEVHVAVAGQLNGLVPGLVQAYLKPKPDINVHLQNLQRTQLISQAKCTKLEYTIHSLGVDSEVELHLALSKRTEYGDQYLTADDELFSFFSHKIHIPLTLKRCPLGFQHNQSIGSCTCLKVILRYMDSRSCDIDTQTVQRTPTLWINASFTGNNTQILAVHQHCPFDYCDPNKHRLDLSYPDQQCAHNRSGILCGECHRGLSLTLGSPKCKQCSNRYLSLLLVFPLAGIALVALLTCLNFTVSVGIINGLSLYVNIVQAIHFTFFPSTNFLSVFVAWMNLDIGMESCLYDGMGFLSMTWLQFVFPVYIWLLASIVIISSHYSTTAAKLVSRDAVKVLATLFLLSYAKLLRTIITILSFTYISYEDSNGITYRTAVWLYDGNVGFMKGKHIPLFLAAIGFGIFYIIPFTLLLLFAPFLQARSHHYRALSWVNKLMPFLDAYQGPYNRKFRFWSGLLLMTRVILFIAFALNSLGDPQINLMLIITFLAILLSVQLLLSSSCQFGTLFKDPLINYLEMFYLLNLMILSTWSLLQMDSTNSSLKTQAVISNVCVGLAFLVFIFILAYHVYLQLKGVGCVTKLWKKMKARSPPPHKVTSSPTTHETMERQSESEEKASIPTTVIQLREPLLTDHYRLDQTDT